MNLQFYQLCLILGLPQHSQRNSLSSTCISIYSPLQRGTVFVKLIAELCGWYNVMYIPLCTSAEEIEYDSWVGVELALFFLCHPLPGWSAAGAAVCCTQGHTVVLFWEKGLLCCQVAVVGRDSNSFVFPPRVTASAAPFSRFKQQPPYSNPMALTPTLTSASPRARSAYEQVCVRLSSDCVHRPRPIRLASTDVTGLEEC